MKIAIVGGGPGGLYAAVLFRRLGHDVTVWERNAPDDTFGFGVVFSDETLDTFETADHRSYAEITERFARWADIDINYRGVLRTSGGHGFSALGRKDLLAILQARASELGADLNFRTLAPGLDELASAYDVVVAADGVNSMVRAARHDKFRPDLESRHSRFMWLGTDLVFEAFTFHIVETRYGVFQIHGYPYSEDASTFIVETDAATWRCAGLDRMDAHSMAPGESDHESIAFCEDLFGDILGAHRLIGNNSKWRTFTTVRNASWSDGNVVLLGDAAHTAHFSIGSGTKLAMEDAIALAWAFKVAPDDATITSVLEAYEDERRPVVESTQRAAQASLEWFEGISRYVGQEPEQFAFNLLTRSRRITYENLRLRDPEFTANSASEFCAAHEVDASTPPMFTPLRLRDLTLPNRVVVSPMDMYSAIEGVVDDFHLVHLGSRALGGAGLVMTEMICVSAEGRITPGCGGLYRDDQIPGWQRIVDFVHHYGDARIGAQIGHSGRKGATRLMWEGIDEPLDRGDDWPLISASALPYLPHSQVPREATLADMRNVIEDFVMATLRAERAGFDLLEVHMAHGYLLSAFLSPLTNVRTDAYGGSFENRARFPLEVLRACRDAWPQHKPLSVRISATDWVTGGFTDDDAVELARLLKQAGVDLIDVSSGQVWADQRPAYGRSYQTPFADRIKNEVGIPTIAVGAISSHEDVNTIILAGRADLCALGRPHLYDPSWTLHAAAEQDWQGVHWVPQYRAGRRRPVDGRRDVARPEPRSFDDLVAVEAPSRWRPVERLSEMSNS